MGQHVRLFAPNGNVQSWLSTASELSISSAYTEIVSISELRKFGRNLPDAPRDATIMSCQNCESNKDFQVPTEHRSMQGHTCQGSHDLKRCGSDESAQRMDAIQPNRGFHRNEFGEYSHGAFVANDHVRHQIIASGSSKVIFHAGAFHGRYDAAEIQPVAGADNLWAASDIRDREKPNVGGGYDKGRLGCAVEPWCELTIVPSMDLVRRSGENAAIPVGQLDGDLPRIIRAAIRRRATASAVYRPRPFGGPVSTPVQSILSGRRDARTGNVTWNPTVGPVRGYEVVEGRSTSSAVTDGYIFGAVLKYACECDPEAEIFWFRNQNERGWELDPVQLEFQRDWMNAITVHSHMVPPTDRYGRIDLTVKQGCWSAAMDTPHGNSIQDFIVAGVVRWRSADPPVEPCIRAARIEFRRNRRITSIRELTREEFDRTVLNTHSDSAEWNHIRNVFR